MQIAKIRDEVNEREMQILRAINCEFDAPLPHDYLQTFADMIAPGPPRIAA